MSKELKLLVVTSIPFPYGLASTNRIISYSKGLAELGAEVSVVTSNWNKDTGKRFETFDGINYRTFGKKRSGPIMAFLGLVFGVFRLIIHLFLNTGKYNSVLLVSNSIVLISMTYIACKIHRVPYFQEKSEFPFVLNKKSWLGKRYAAFYVNNVYKLFDGMIIMTFPLLEYFKPRISKKCKTIVVPMTVEAQRFQGVEKADFGFSYIGYCGYIGGNKDGVENLIRAFSIVKSKFPELRLLLIGPGTEKEYKLLKNVVAETKVKDVIFHGSVSRDEMPALLCGAEILALARPSSLQSTGGFPTKLGEYLSTGNPTIVTKVGDIPRYLTDGENAFLVDPDNNEKFAQKILMVLENFVQAKQVAENGKKLVYDTFSYKKQSARLLKFFSNFI